LLALVKLGAAAMTMNFIRIIFVTPIFLLAAAIIMLLVARFDEGYKPCPYNRPAGYAGKRKTAFTAFPNFCGQTMNPRVTTCCRVPCFQNFTANFDPDGNPDDCVTQTFGQFSVAIAGFCVLGISSFFLLMMALEHYIKKKSKSHSRSIIDHVFSPSIQHAEVTEKIKVQRQIIERQQQQQHATAAGDEEVQVV
jgi:hypothetical protein